MTWLKKQVQRFARDEDGVLMAEFVLVLPMLIWAYLALFVYWDVFRSYNTLQKDTYTISDHLSRQESVDNTFLDGMQPVMNYLIDTDQSAQLRITSVEWDETRQRYTVLFSRSPGRTLPALNNGTIQAYKDRIPEMADKQSVIIVEAFVDYKPAFDAGVGERTFEQFVVTRPRHFIRICLKAGCPT